MRRYAVSAGMRRLLVLAAAAALAVPSSASAANNVVVSAGFRYLPPTLTVARGDTLTHVNADVAPHDVTAVATGADNLPIFYGDVVGTGGQSDVRGVSSLAPGGYAFYCSVHPTMTGTLTVT